MAEMIDRETGEIFSSHVRFSAERNELFAALAKAQARFAAAEKAGVNPHFGRKYVTLASMIEAYRKPLAEEGLCLMQPPGNVGASICVTTIIGHASGQWCESTIYAAPGKFDAQSVGSLITYLRRYGAASMLNIAPEDDDDGNAAVAGAPATRSTRANPAAQKPSPDRDEALAAYRRIQAEIDSHDLPEPLWPKDDVETVQKYDGAGLIQLRQRLAHKLQLKEMPA